MPSRLSSIARQKPLPKRTKPIARSQIKRRPKSAEKRLFQYGPADYQEYLRERGCAVLMLLTEAAGKCSGRVELAHTTSGGGVALKSHFSNTLGLCSAHHRAYDEHRKPFDREETREVFQIRAQQVYNDFMMQKSADG